MPVTPDRPCALEGARVTFLGGAAFETIAGAVAVSVFFLIIAGQENSEKIPEKNRKINPETLSRPAVPRRGPEAGDSRYAS